MKLLQDEPRIERALRTGYPHALEYARTCPLCGIEILDGEDIYEIEQDKRMHDVCVDCFRDWVGDYLSTNPAEVAVALNVGRRAC